MSTAIIQCEGCKKTFTLSGHGKHLRTTTKSACIALRERIRSQLPDESSTEDLSDCDFDDPADSNDFDPPPSSPQSFGGDVFGAYDDDYWDQYDEYQPGLGDDEDEDNEPYHDEDQPPASDDDDDFQDDDDEDAANLEAEHGWEPPANEVEMPMMPPLPTTMTTSLKASRDPTAVRIAARISSYAPKPTSSRTQTALQARRLSPPMEARLVHLWIAPMRLSLSTTHQIRMHHSARAWSSRSRDGRRCEDLARMRSLSCYLLKG